MFKRFYGEQVTKELAQQFQQAATSLNKPVSPAHLQGFLLVRKENPQSAIDEISKILPSGS